MIGLPNPYVLLGAVLAAAAIGLGGYMKGHHDASTAAALAAESAAKERALKQVQLLDNLRETESNLEAKAEEGRADDAKTIGELNQRVADLDQRLRQRPARPAGGGAPTTCAGPDRGTGAGLYREDGLFLAGEAAAAKRIVVQRDRCYARYEDAQRQLEALAAKVSPTQGAAP